MKNQKSFWSYLEEELTIWMEDQRVDSDMLTNVILPLNLFVFLARINVLQLKRYYYNYYT